MARLAALLTTALVVVLVLGFAWLRPFGGLTADVPPTESLAFESVRLDETGIHANLRAAGSHPVSIAQVQIDGAFRLFSQLPEGPVERLGRATLDIPYDWIAGEPLTIVVLTSTGVTFEHVVEVAYGSAALGGYGILQLIGIGLFVGLVPILAGYGFLPLLRSYGARGRDFALGLTLGLLLFLLIDTMGEGLEFAGEASGALKADMAFWVVMLVTTGVLVALARRHGVPEGARLAFFVALGIGFHNLGEGIAIGASITLGQVALAAFLVIGFFLHNLSESIAIAAPYRGKAIGMPVLIGLALLAGGPAAIGTVAGAFAFTPLRAALAFAIGAGAILQVLIEIGGLLLRNRAAGDTIGTTAGLGFGAGLVVMYATSLLIAG